MGRGTQRKRKASPLSKKVTFSLPPKFAFKQLHKNFEKVEDIEESERVEEVVIPVAKMITSRKRKLDSVAPRRSERLKSKIGVSHLDLGIISSFSPVGKVPSLPSILASSLAPSPSTPTIKWEEWSAATDTKNYMMDDAFLDVLSRKSSGVHSNALYSKEIGDSIANIYKEGFTSKLLSQGNIFEKQVIEALKRDFPNDTTYIGGNPRGDNSYTKTLEAMHNGVPIIFQAVLRNYSNKTYGIADIIIRSDWINRCLDVDVLSDEEASIVAPFPKAQSQNRDKVRGKRAIKRNYHYLVIDIKCRALPLRADGIHLRNDGNIKSHKSQVYIYTLALGEMQGYTSDYGFLLGTRYKYTSQNVAYSNTDCFERLGKIDFATLDIDYVSKTEKALDWLQDVRTNNYDLTQYPLPRDELYPNMCNHFDYPYHGIKKTFAEKNNDLTLLWNVGPKQRRIANSKGIYDWKDPKCTSTNLGFKPNGKRRVVIDRILEANHSAKQVIFPKKIKTLGWRTRPKLELFCDFEMSCSVFNEIEDLTEMNTNSFIFMIGVGYIDPVTKKWIYRDFTVNRINEGEEKRICVEFYLFVKDMEKKYGKVPVWHYSHAEKSSWKRFIERDGGRTRDLFWKDLLKLFLEEPIGVKGALNYSLKTIAKAFFDSGFITTSYDQSTGCSNGSDAALQGHHANRDSIERNISMKDHEYMPDIIKYNHIDVRVLYEILEHLRKNH